MKTAFAFTLFFVSLGLFAQNEVKLQTTVIEFYQDLIAEFESKGQKQQIASYGERIKQLKKGMSDDQSMLLALSADLAQIYFNYGDMEGSLGYYDKLLRVLDRQNYTEPRILANVYHRMATVHIEKRDYKKAFEYLDTAKELWDKNSLETPTTFYTSYGNIYTAIGITDKALIYYREGEKAAKKQFGEFSIPAIVNFYNIATAYNAQGDYTQALEYLDKTLLVGEQLMGKNNPELARTFQLQGVIYKNQKNYRKAHEIFDKTEGIYQKAYGEKHLRMAGLYLHMGQLFSEEGNYDDADNYFQKSLKTHQLIHGESGGLVALLHYELGRNLFRKKDWAKAIDYFQKSNALNNLAKHGNAGRDMNINAENIYDFSVFLVSSVNLASSFLKLYEETGDENHLRTAQNQFQKTTLVIDTFRQDLQNGKDKRTISETYNEVYFGGMEAFLKTYDEKKNLASFEEAFAFLEKSKASVLKEALFGTNIEGFADLPDTIIELERDLKLDKAFYQSKITSELSGRQVDSMNLAKYENRLFSISRTQDSVQSVLRQNYPNYYGLKYQNKVTSIKQVQQFLDKETTLLAYFTRDSITYAFTISKKDYSVKKLETHDLQKNIEAYRESVTEVI